MKKIAEMLIHIAAETSLDPADQKQNMLFRDKILQGLGVGPGSATKRWPYRKIAQKSVFFS